MEKKDSKKNNNQEGKVTLLDFLKTNSTFFNCAYLSNHRLKKRSGLFAPGAKLVVRVGNKTYTERVSEPLRYHRNGGSWDRWQNWNEEADAFKS